MKIGKINKLVVEGKGEDGYTLRDPESEQTAFLPNRNVDKNLKTNDLVKVFVYLDTSTQRPLANTNFPLALVDEFARLEVIEAPEFGAFLDWGIEKDLLVPGNEQKRKLRVGERALVRVCMEEGTNRIYGTTKFGKHLQNAVFDVHEKSKVDIVPVEESELGFRCIVNKKYLGLIYHSEIFERIDLGKRYRAYVKKIRTDGLLDLALQPQGARNLFESKDRVLEIIKKNSGRVSVTDKSSPEDIYDMFGMSKKSFKAAVGMLYKDRQIVIQKDGIELVNNDSE